ncbi:MAG TPA: HD domain-containing phosphohydrolase [Vicinamibacterales bacterium]|jgi:putative nucleotidyltransferase with HDIG domain
MALAGSRGTGRAMTRRTPGLSPRARVFIATVVSTGTIAIGASAYDLVVHPRGSEWLILAGLTLLTGSFSIKLPSINARISVSEAFVFAAVLLFGPAAATIIVALDTIILTSWARNRARDRIRVMFNVSAGATAIWLSAFVFRFVLPHTTAPPKLEQLLAPVLLLALCYFAINSSLIAVAVACEKPVSPVSVWKDNFAWIGLNYLGGASVAMLLVTYRQSIDITALSVIVPLLVITYLTFRTSLGRLEDANLHVVQVNELYLSTIETLAMAVDAKDQITHGHIRRVQVYAVEMARRLGVHNEEQLKAIEAAALLHDMGKLAIPEHILNKPGKLTTAEFETMKRHADIGADLLSSIRFPYPVVPIVRHHHECWNGTGYPAGISGTDIPLGARILGVVDCFDALNSDRPYRPRLEPHEAFEILRQRRGAMYDPLVVDEFIAAFPEIAPLADAAGQHARTLIDARAERGKTTVAGPLEEIRASAAESAALIQVRQHVVEAKGPAEAMNIITQGARQLTPSTVCAYYEYSSTIDQLVCILASGGENNKPLLGITIRPGERVTGWVAANRRTISNSDATLDLGQTALLVQPEPRSTISAAVVVGENNELYGVLTGYSPKDSAFTHRHVYAFEQLAEALGSYFFKTRQRPGRLFVVSQRHGRRQRSDEDG